MTRRRSPLLHVVLVVARNPQLRRVELAFATFNCGEYATWIAMLVYAYARGGVVEAGIVATVVLIPAAVFPPFAARMGERYAQGKVLLAGYVAQALTCVAVAVAMFADADRLVVYALLVGPAVAFTMTRPTQSAFAPALARAPEELTATNVVSSWIESISTLVAPALAGVVLALDSTATVFALAGVGCLVGAVLVLPLANLGVVTVASTDPADDDARVGGALSLFRRDRYARMLLLLFAAQMVAIGALDVLIVELAEGVLHLGGDWAGYLTAAFGAGGVIAITINARLLGLTKLVLPLVIALVVWTVAFMGLGTVPTAVGALVLLGVAGSARTTFDVAGRTLLQRVARSDLLARVFGLLEGLEMGALAVGTLLAPLLVTLGGVSAAFISIGAILPLVAVATGRALLDIDRHATVPVVQIALLRSLPLFAGLPPPTLESLARALEPVSVPRGSVVIEQGAEGDRFFVVADGEVEIVRDGQVVARRGRGVGFGEIALLYDVARTATVRARADAQLYALDRAPFLLALTGRTTVDRAPELAAVHLEELRALDEETPISVDEPATSQG
ncbi:MAG TPA: MFS transporter [Gaiellaceae bacterium]|nr:MFS transporter [Gaiellaceae bacterium]